MAVLTSVNALNNLNHRAIVYHPQLNTFVKSIAGTIFLQQVLYRYTHNNSEPFYKFNESCDHELYRTGDSWSEELGMSVDELTTARRKVATKVNTGDSKKDLRQVFIDDELAPVERIVLYWTDANRVTYYEVNIPLYLAYVTLAIAPQTPLYEIYQDLAREFPKYFDNPNLLGNPTSPDYLVTGQSQITSNSEKNTKKNPKKTKGEQASFDLGTIESKRKTGNFTPLEELIVGLNKATTLNETATIWVNTPLRLKNPKNDLYEDYSPNHLYNTSSSYKEWVNVSCVNGLKKLAHRVSGAVAMEKIIQYLGNMNFFIEWIERNNKPLFDVVAERKVMKLKLGQ